MADPQWRTSPDHTTTGWPRGVPYIIGNEACERFSYYGMRAILYVHLGALYVLVGQVQEQANRTATSTTHLFYAAVYAFPMVGAILADRYWGKYKTILYLSLMYCVGHGLLAAADIPSEPTTRLYIVYAGLACIAIGAGGIKPCVSANVGDQFGAKNWFRVRTMYQIFYFSINLGSAFATMIIPAVRGDGGVSWRVSLAFGIPGILMAIATVFFWLGRDQFVHVPPRPGGRLGKLDTLAGGLLFMSIGHLFFTASLPASVIVGLTLLFLVAGLAVFLKRQKIEQDDGFLAILLYTVVAHLTGKRANAATAPPPAGEGTSAPGKGDEQGRAAQERILRSRFWPPAVERFGLQAVEGPAAVFKVITIFIFIPVFWAIFDQHASTWIEQARQMDRVFFGTEILPSQVPTLNPIMVMVLIVVMNFVYKGVEKLGVQATPLRRMVTGMFVAAASFAIAATIQEAIDAQGVGKVNVAWQIIAYLVLTTSEVMVSITALEFAYTQAPKKMKSTVMGLFLLTVTAGNVLVSVLASLGDLPPAQFFWLFAGLACVVGVVMGARAYYYVPHDFPQE